jgi:hypothetical protein
MCIIWSHSHGNGAVSLSWEKNKINSAATAADLLTYLLTYLPTDLPTDQPTDHTDLFTY